jgi:hypothetical protein
MTGVLPSVRRVVLAALMAAALMLGAVSVHAMAEDSVGASSSGVHVMAAHDHSMHGGAMAGSMTASMVGSATVAMTGSGCDGACELGGALITVLCVAAAVALAVLLFLPGAASARGILGRVVVYAPAFEGRGRPVRTPDLLQLSISRT